MSALTESQDYEQGATVVLGARSVDRLQSLAEELVSISTYDSLARQMSNTAIHLAQATRSRRIPRFARAEPLSDEP